MEANVNEKIIEQFVRQPTTSIVSTQPINIDIESINVQRLITANTLISNDGNYFIRYGGFASSGNYDAIEVYSMDSLEQNQALYIFDDIKIQGNSIFINDLHQDETGRFYGIGRYYDGNNYYSYFIIFNNFIQDGFLQINKYYTPSTMGLNLNGEFLTHIIKQNNTGKYFFTTDTRLIQFTIDILEGNELKTASIIDGGSITIGTYDLQLNIIGNNIIITKLWQSINSTTVNIEYTKKVINIEDDWESSYTLTSVYNKTLTTSTFINIDNQKYAANVFYLNNNGNICIDNIDLNSGTKNYVYDSRTFNNNSSIVVSMEKNYIIVTNSVNIFIAYINDNNKIIEFHIDSFSNYFAQVKIIQQYNLIFVMGITGGANQTITTIKNIYSKNITSPSYYNNTFLIPTYMNLYANSSNNTSIIFSRNVTGNFSRGNQIISTFNVPNFLLNNGNIQKANVYGHTNYLLNTENKNFNKNKFENLFFNYIYNINIIDNTNGLNELNQVGSNRLANSLWNSLDNTKAQLSKARITYEDLSTKIINLNVVIVTSTTALLEYQVTGNIIKIEYLSNDEKTVYATLRVNLSGTKTISQTVKIE